MTRFTFSCCMLMLSFQISIAQNVHEANLPQKIDTLKKALRVNQFPNPVKASLDPEKEGTYFWKHTTSVMSPESKVQVIEIGAYLFYNNQWNLRASYSPKEFAKWFNCPKAVMKAGEPYTFSDNWRRDTRLYGGWAMWYFIGIDESGQKVCGYDKIHTLREMY